MLFYIRFAMDNQRFQNQLRFILEIDKLKSIFRQSYVLNTNRKENDAEHSWHLAMMAMILEEHANEKIDAIRVIKMLLLHDIVEIDAGDTFMYDDEAAKNQNVREQAAAERLFGLLPSDLSAEFKNLWLEFETHQSPEAKFAKSLDRLMPLLHNFHAGGKTWKEHGVKRSQVIKANKIISEGSAELWNYAQAIIEDAVQKGYLET